MKLKKTPIIAMGRLIQKIHLQEAILIKYPPIKGPRIKKIDPILTIIPEALPLDSFGKVSAIREVWAGNMIAAPIP